MMSEVDRTWAFLDSLKRSSNWVVLWDNEAPLILQPGNLWGYALAGLAESCMAGGTALSLPKSGFRTAASATKSSISLSRERGAVERRQHLPRPATIQQENSADIFSNRGSIDDRELPGNRIFNAWKTPFKPRTVPSLPDSAKRLDRSALFRLAGGICEPESLPRRGAVGRMLRRNIRPTPLPQIDLPLQRSWLAGLSRKAIGALGRIKPELLVLQDPSASAKPPRSKKGLIEDRLSPSPESERAPIDLLARFSEKHGHASVAGRGGFRQENACHFPVSTNKASQQEAGIFPASRLTSGEALTFSFSPGVALELSMLNKIDRNKTEYGNAQDETVGDIPESLQSTVFFRAVNEGDGNWPLAASSRESLSEVGIKPMFQLSPGEESASSAASRKALELSMLNKGDRNEAEYGNAQDETMGDIPESLQSTVFFRAVNEGDGNWPLAASSRESLSEVEIQPVFQLSPGEESAFSAASRKARELSMLNKSDRNEAEYGNAQDETVGDIPESLQSTVFFRAVNEGDGNWPLAASSRESLSEVEIQPVFQLSPGEESAFSAASRKALELSMLNKSDRNEAEYGSAQDETMGNIPENMQPAAFSRAANIGNRPLADCKTSRLVFGMPLMPSLFREEADASSSIAISTRGEPAKSLLSLQNRRETASEEDLEALAAKIKRILEEEARRHGIDV